MSNIRREVVDGVCILTFDCPDSAANVFNSATLDELSAHLDFVENTAGLQGLIVTSAKNTVFIAGADLKELNTLDAIGVQHFIARGQDLFNRLAALKIPTAAAIHGACMGGGYELALACGYRVASPDKATRIGLPEIQLGILPAWGGSTRLPRLIGLPKALDIILAGKTPSASSAKRLGMVDEIAPRELLMTVALAAVRRHARAKPAPAALWAVLSPALAPLAKKRVMNKTRGHYPAPLAALKVVAAACGGSPVASMARERAAVLALAQTPECKNLMRLFFQTEKAKKSEAKDGPASETAASSADPALRASPLLAGLDQAPPPVHVCKPPEHPLVAVIGAGVMGAGIAQWLAGRNMRVILRDLDAQKVGEGMGRIDKLLADRRIFKAKEARDIRDRITPAPLPVPLSNADLVIEAAVEKMLLKKRIFADLDRQVGPQTILATNTSALSITELASATADPGRVVGIHFFNPVHRMPLVEVVLGRETRPQVAGQARELVRKMGKLPVTVQDSPGFLVNRILMPYMLEAARFFDHGASIENIDEAMLDFGMPMGPLRLIDEVGLDVAEDVALTLGAAFGERMAAPPVVARMLGAGLLGKKSGRGFYLHPDEEYNLAVRNYRSNDGQANLPRAELQRRMVLLMINEAARCLEEGVAADAADIDFAMVMGTGFAPFRGGPLRHADAVGVTKVTAMMQTLADSGEPHYAPCAGLCAMALSNQSFFR